MSPLCLVSPHLVEVHEAHHRYAMDEDRVDGLGYRRVVRRAQSTAAQLIERHHGHTAPLNGPRDTDRTTLRAARGGVHDEALHASGKRKS